MGVGVILRLMIGLALCAAPLGCFEVPPLPDSEAECVDDDDCTVGETCEDTECVFVEDDVVLFSVDCTGVEKAVIVVRCGGRLEGAPCMGDGTEEIFDCPTDSQISVCCGESADACTGAERVGKLLVFANQISPDPEDGWTCDPAPGPAALTCTHPGFDPHEDIVAHFQCDVSSGSR